MLDSRRLLVLVSSVAAVFFLPATAHADSATFGARIGYYADADAAFAGAELLLKVAPRVYFNPNLEIVFQDDSYLTFNADFHYDFPSHGQTFVWAGAGLGIVSINPPGNGEGHTDAALNLLFGVGLRKRPVIPYFQAKLIAKDNAEFSVAFGLRF